jgi:serine/threonine protein phosphatase PrpC
MAEPEIVTKYLTADDKYLVIASDGIFELMTNTDVMNICKRSEDPVEACEMLTKTAYKTWLEHENRTDDITVIVCFLSSSFIPGPEEANETTKDLIPDEPAAKDVTAESDDPIEKSEENEDSGVTDCGTALCF